MMQDPEGMRGRNWVRVPDFINIERLASVLPGTGFDVARYSFNGIILFAITMVKEPGAMLLIADTPDGRILQGMSGSTPMGPESLHLFLQLYWRFVFEDILGKEGYQLENALTGDDDSISLAFYKETEVMV